jgi:hypothetical protein
VTILNRRNRRSRAFSCLDSPRQLADATGGTYILVKRGNVDGGVRKAIDDARGRQSDE